MRRYIEVKRKFMAVAKIKYLNQPIKTFCKVFYFFIILKKS